MTDTLAEIIDWVYMHRMDAEQVTVRVGVWNDADSPYSVYATMHDSTDNVLYGESTYGSNTVDEALRGLLAELEAAQP